MIYWIKPKTIVMISSIMTAVLLIGLLNLLRINESITGNVIVAGSDSLSIGFVFIAIALVAGGVLFLTLYNRYGKRY